MEELGLTVIAVNPEDQTKLFETIDMISTAADVVEKGQELEYWISDALESLKKSLDGVETPSVYLAGNSASVTDRWSGDVSGHLIETPAA